MIIYLILVLVLTGVTAQMVALKQWAAGAAHTDLINSVNIYNDNSKFVSGSKDNDLKVWSMADFSLLHTQTFGDYVTHISLHPVDNRIFVLVFDGTIKVLDPSTYATLHTGSYPTGGGNGNSLRFFSSNSKYVISGYDNTAPILHYYDSTTYASIAGGPTTTFASGEQITVMSVSKDQQLLAAISTEAAAPINLMLYNLATNTLAKTFVDNFALLKWVSFSPHLNELYLTSNDKTLKAYKINPTTGKYDVSYSYPTDLYGFPNCINVNIKDQLVFSANKDIVFLNTAKTYPELIFSRKDVADVFVMDLSLDGKYLVSGMRNGEITLWEIDSKTSKKDQNVLLLIILGSCIGGFILLIIVACLIHRFCCKNQIHPNQNQNEDGKRKRIQDKTEDSLDYDNRNNSFGIS